MANAPRICVVGSTNIDLTFRTPRLPHAGETLSGRGFQLGFGGKGANQAVMAARLGARVAMVGKVGRDVFGEQAMHNFRTEGIDTTMSGSTPDHPTGTASIVVDDEARNCIIVVPGANQSLTPAGRAQCRRRDPRRRFAHLPTRNATGCDDSRRCKPPGSGRRHPFQPGAGRGLPDELLTLCDLFVPNETEAELLTGLPVTNPEEAEQAALALRERGAAIVIITLGSRGALVADGQGNELIRGTKVDAVDSTGAGDAFIGSLAVYLGEGLTLREAVRRANAVAALSVTRPGTQTSFPTRAEVEAFWSGERPA